MAGYSSDILTGGTATADSTYPDWTADLACDDNATKGWSSTNTALPHWWKYDLGVGVTKKVAKIGLFPYGATGDLQVKDFDIQGSNDDSAWDTLYTGQHSNVAGEEFFTFSNIVAYRYYRILVTSEYHVGNYYVAIWEIEMFEFIPDTYTKTVSAKARIKYAAVTKTISSKARVKKSGNDKTVSAKSNVTNYFIDGFEYPTDGAAQTAYPTSNADLGQCYSESTIKTQGSHSLKFVIPEDEANTQVTFIRTVNPSISASGKGSIRFDIYATRIGSNIQVIVNDLYGGFIVDITPNITQINTWQTVIVDISAINNFYKSHINQIYVVINDSLAANTFYLDNMYLSVLATKTVSAKARTKYIDVTKTSSAKARKKIVDNTKTVSSKTKVILVRTKTVSSKADVQNAVSQTVSVQAKVRYPDTHTWTPLSAKARVKQVRTKTVSSLARVFVTQLKTVLSKSRIKNTSTKTVTVKADVKKSGFYATNNIAWSYAAVKNVVNRTVSFLASIKNTITIIDINVFARVKKVGIPQTVETQVRIKKIITETVSAKANIFSLLNTYTKTVLSKLRTKIIAGYVNVSNGDVIDEDMTDISDWTDGDNDSGVSSQVIFDGKSCMKLDSGTPASYGNSFAHRFQNLYPQYGRTVFSIKLYHETLGTLENYDDFSFVVFNGSYQLPLYFTSQGLFVSTGGQKVEIGNNLVLQGVWQEWTFDVTWAAPFIQPTANVYLDRKLVNSNIPLEYSGIVSNLLIDIHQRGFTTPNQVTYVDYIKVGSNFLNLNTNSVLSQSRVKKSNIINTVDVEGRVAKEVTQTVSAKSKIYKVATITHTKTVSVKTRVWNPIPQKVVEEGIGKVYKKPKVRTVKFEIPVIGTKLFEFTKVYKVVGTIKRILVAGWNLIATKQFSIKKEVIVSATKKIEIISSNILKGSKLISITVTKQIYGNLKRSLVSTLTVLGISSHQVGLSKDIKGSKHFDIKKDITLKGSKQIKVSKSQNIKGKKSIIHILRALGFFDDED